MEMYQSDYNSRVSSREVMKGISKTTVSNPYNVASSNPLRNSTLNDKSFKSSLSSGAAASLSRAFFPAYVGFEGVNAMTNVALDMYDEKFKELGLGKYAPSSVTPTPSVPTPKSADVPEPIIPEPSPDYPSDTLISVLKDSNYVSTAIARQLENSNNIALHGNSEISKSINALVSIISIQNEINISYKEVELENSVNMSLLLSSIDSSISNLSGTIQSVSTLSQEIETAYNEQDLVNFDLLLGKLQNIASNVSKVSTFLESGIQVKRTENEMALTTKQLEHITYETTEIQLDNLGDSIPSATPQQMRAIKDAVVAKKNSDENTFELDNEDIDDIFNGMPDISSIFAFTSKTSRLPTPEELL